MRVIVLGPPGCDRETIAGLVAASAGVPVIRLAGVIQEEVQAESPAGARAMRYMNAGELVPAEVLLGMIRDRLDRFDAVAGFVLTGFPNPLVPAPEFDAMLADLGRSIDRVVDLVLTDAEVVRRLSGRRTCRGCAEVWAAPSAPTAPNNVCDRCGGELFQRFDDRGENVVIGLRSYRPATAPTLSHYLSLGKLVSVDATLPLTEIVASAMAGLGPASSNHRA
jgi:adenylate kinase